MITNNIFYVIVLLILNFKTAHTNLHFFNNDYSENGKRYGYFSEKDRLQCLEEAREMFQFGYDNYMKYAYPMDELDPIHCVGRGPDYEKPENININDVLGDYSLTLVDSLDMLAIMGNVSEFKRAVRMIVDDVSFHKHNTVQVFEATIRMLGGLLSAHLLIVDPERPFGDLRPWQDYDNELLLLANDLAVRLAPAFDNSSTDIPLPRVNLVTGMPHPEPYYPNTTCTSCAGSLILEFSLLSRLMTGETAARWETLARGAVYALFDLRHKDTKLFGNVVDCTTRLWLGTMSGLGAGLDSFYEYMLKSFILFGDARDLQMFVESYEAIKSNLRRGRMKCNEGTGYPPIYINVEMQTGKNANTWIDSLQASWSGVQVLYGDVEEAICSHAIYYAIWRRYGTLPERFNWNTMQPIVNFYPLRPELAESTYLLYKATSNPFYLHVGRDILNNLNKITKVKCGYATVHDVLSGELEDRMESFFLSETCKYLYLLFDFTNPINEDHHNFLFTTEGHVIGLSGNRRLIRPRSSSTSSKTESVLSSEFVEEALNRGMCPVEKPRDATLQIQNSTNCQTVDKKRKHFLPLKHTYFNQLNQLMGIS